MYLAVSTPVYERYNAISRERRKVQQQVSTGKQAPAPPSQWPGQYYVYNFFITVRSRFTMWCYWNPRCRTFLLHTIVDCIGYDIWMVLVWCNLVIFLCSLVH